MSLSRAQIRSRIQSNLNNSVGTFFDDALVNDSIQDGYDECVIDTQCIECTTTINFEANRIYYDLYNTVLIPSNYLFWRITRLFNSNTNRWIRCVDSRVLDKFRFDWENSGGSCWFAYIVNFQYLGFFPHYKSDTGYFKLLTKVGRDVLSSDNQIPQIPDQFSRLLESYATADLLEIYREFKKARDYWEDFYKLKEQLRLFVPSRQLPNHVWQLNDLDTDRYNSP